MNPSTTNKTACSNRPSYRRAGVGVTGIVVTLVAVLGLAGGTWYLLTRSDGPKKIEPITVQVTRGEFVAHVLDQGEVQSSENIEIRCEARARNGQLIVIDCVPEGTFVNEGDFLVKLESTGFETELEQQKIALVTTETSVIQAETELATAQASKLEYEQGTFVESKKQIENEIYDAESQIQTALQELNQAKAVLAHSMKLQTRGFITRQQLLSDEFAVKKAEIALEKGKNSEELARKKLYVLEEITRTKELVRLDSDIRAAEVKLASQRDAYVVEKAKLAEIKDQIEKCNIRVPPGVSGQVVYAQERNRGNDWVLEKGTVVRESQVLIRLPNPDMMEVKALINEQSITQVRPNMPVSIKVDALSNRALKGIVTKVNQYAESSGWMRSSVRKYGVTVKILNPPPALKPGMNASVSIQTSFSPDALMAPLQTVYGVLEQQFCLAHRPDGSFETLEVKVEGDNSEMVMFSQGVEEGTRLVMNPAAYTSYMDLPEIKVDRKIELPEGTAMVETPTGRQRYGGPEGASGGARPAGSRPAAGRSEGESQGEPRGRPAGGRPAARAQANPESANVAAEANATASVAGSSANSTDDAVGGDTAASDSGGVGS